MKVMASAPEANRTQRPFASFDPDTIRAGLWDLNGKGRPRARGWADPGERVALKYVAIEARCRPILDIGVGAGRTTELLRAISRDYMGIDEAPQMVDLCRAQHPEAQISLMHPSDLGRFEPERFSLVVFSFNGIDTASPTDRAKILREVQRVLQPNGLFVMSAHNRDSLPLEDMAPSSGYGTSAPMPLEPGTWGRVRSLPSSLRNYVRQRVLHRGDDEWDSLQQAAQQLVSPTRYTTLAEQKRQLRDAGLQTELVLDNLAGRPVANDANTRAFAWMHYIARKL